LYFKLKFRSPDNIVFTSERIRFKFLNRAFEFAINFFYQNTFWNSNKAHLKHKSQSHAFALLCVRFSWPFWLNFKSNWHYLMRPREKHILSKFCFVVYFVWSSSSSSSSASHINLIKYLLHYCTHSFTTADADAVVIPHLFHFDCTYETNVNNAEWVVQRP
jgi:hypothetical protein